MASKARKTPFRRKGYDRIFVDELTSYVDNDRSLYDQKEAVRTALTRKVCKGVFSKPLAAKGFRHVVDRAAKMYAREFMSPSGKVTTLTRQVAAEKFVAEYMRDIRGYRRRGTQDLPKEAIKILDSGRCMSPTASSGLMGLRRKRRRTRRQ